MRVVFSGLLVVGSLFAGVPAMAQSGMAQMGSETALLDRCAVPDDVSVFSRSQDGFSALVPVTSEPVLTGTGSPPSLMVDGWKPATGPADQLLRVLGAEAGFTVMGETNLPVVAWNRSAASLEETIDTLAKAGGVSWVYSGSNLTLSRPIASVSSYRATLPQSRDARLAFVDVLRGNGADVSIEGDQAVVTGSADSIAKAKTALDATRQILVFDVLFLRGRPSEGRYNWAALGMNADMAKNAGGQFSTSLSPSEIVSRLQAQGDVQQDSGQTVGAPAGWAAAIPPAQCGRGYGEIVVAPKLEGEMIEAKVSGNGFDAEYASLLLGSSMFIAAPQPRGGWIDMVFIRPRVVAFSN